MVTRIPGPCVRGRIHTFDHASGWCLHGCGWRSDGACSHPATPDQALDIIDVTEPRRRDDAGLFA